MGKTIRRVERGNEFGISIGKKFKKHSERFPELISPRVFYNKIVSKEPRAKQLAKKGRTTYK